MLNTIRNRRGRTTKRSTTSRTSRHSLIRKLLKAVTGIGSAILVATIGFDSNVRISAGVETSLSAVDDGHHGRSYVHVDEASGWDGWGLDGAIVVAAVECVGGGG